MLNTKWWPTLQKLSRPLEEDVRYGTFKLGNFSRAVVLDGGNLTALESLLRKHKFNAQGYQRRPNHEYFEAPELSWMVGADPRIASLDQEVDPRSEQSSTGCFPIGGRSDIWSLGAVVIALMGGIWIDPDDVSLECWQKISREQTFVLRTVQLYLVGGKRWDRSLLPPGYSATLRAVLERMLMLDPKKRIDTLEAYALVGKEYERWLAESTLAPGDDDEDDAIESGPEDDNDPFTDTQHPRPGGCRPGGQPTPPSSNDEDDDDGWRPKFRPIGRPTPLPPRENDIHSRPSLIRKQNVGPLRDRTKFDIFGRPRLSRPRLSSTASLVRVGAGFQRLDRPEPFAIPRHGGMRPKAFGRPVR